MSCSTRLPSTARPARLRWPRMHCCSNAAERRTSARPDGSRARSQPRAQRWATTKGRSDLSAADLFDLTGKVGLVTGANSGLGFGFASGIAKCGGDVVVWSRRADKNEQAAEKLRGMGARRVHCQSVDVSDEAQVVAGMAEAIEAMGRIDGVVANAGGVSGAPLHQMTTKMYNDL